MIKAFAGAVLLMLAGCASTGPDFAMSDVDAMRPGITTYEQAQKVLGRPTSVAKDPDGSIRAGWARAETYGFLSGSRAVLVQFGADGRMVRVISRGQAGWNSK